MSRFPRNLKWEFIFFPVIYVYYIYSRSEKSGPREHLEIQEAAKYLIFFSGYLGLGIFFQNMYCDINPPLSPPSFLSPSPNVGPEWEIQYKQYWACQISCLCLSIFSCFLFVYLLLYLFSKRESWMTAMQFSELCMTTWEC